MSECQCGCGGEIPNILRRPGVQRRMRFIKGHNRRATPIVDRFWAKVDKNGPTPEHCPWLGNCWVWTGGKRNGGYGALNYRIEVGKLIQDRAHRYAWTLTDGPIPDGLDVLHKCDNPPCVRRAHLFLGTDLDNALDKVAKGRQGHGGGKLSFEIATTIREHYSAERLTFTTLAKTYGVCISTISNIVNYKIWTRR